MAVVAHGIGRVPVTGYQVVLAPAGHLVTLNHPRTGPVVVARENQVALWCAGTEMLTTLTVRIHDTAPAGPSDAPAAGPLPGDPAAEEVEWVVSGGGLLLAYADDYGATPVGDVAVPSGTWRLRAAVAHRVAATALGEQLIAEDEAGYDHPDPAAAAGPVPGPEVWLLDLWPAT